MVERRDDDPAWIKQAEELIAQMEENDKLEKELMARATGKSYIKWLEDKVRLQQDELNRMRSALNLIFNEFRKDRRLMNLTKLLTNMSKNHNLKGLGINYDL